MLFLQSHVNRIVKVPKSYFWQRLRAFDKIQTLLPRTIKTGNAIGIVTRAPRTEPLFKLKAFPKTNKCKKIYELIIDKGNIKRLKVIFSLVPNEKTKLNIEIGSPINNQ